MRRWLQGDLKPAVEGAAEMEGAVERGFTRLFVRMLGLPSRRFQIRTDAFDFLGGR